MPKEGETGARLTSGELTLGFVWRGDRFVHAVRRGDDEMISAETSELETPVYQEVHQQGELAFASGMSGDRHWSASVEPVEGGFAFDVACRVKSPAESLGVAYQGGASIRVEPTDDSTRTGDESTWLLRCQPPAGELPYTVRCQYRVIARNS